MSPDLSASPSAAVSPVISAARIAVLGTGAVGARVARQLVSSDSVECVVLRNGEDIDRAEVVAGTLGAKATVDRGGDFDPVDADVVVLAGPVRTDAGGAEAFMRRGQHVVTLTDSVPAVQALLALDNEARERDVTIAIGCGFAPGLSCVLACHAASWFDSVDEIHVAKAGTGGPACARQHHRALRGMAIDWRDGAWTHRPGGSGRELCWFPDPIRAQDCYRAALCDALLLQPTFPRARRITSRVTATRRDRITTGLPMLWPTHPEGGPGAIRVELRGRRGVVHETAIVGVMDRPAVAGGAVAAVASLWALEGRFTRAGAAGLAELVEPLRFLSELADRGIRAALFEGNADSP